MKRLALAIMATLAAVPVVAVPARADMICSYPQYCRINGVDPLTSVQYDFRGAAVAGVVCPVSGSAKATSVHLSSPRFVDSTFAPVFWGPAASKGQTKVICQPVTPGTAGR